MLAASKWTNAEIAEPDQLLCKFASDLTRSPSQMSERHILDLRGQGFTDQAIHDATQVVAYFNYINRIADSLNVDLEDDVHAWEKSTPG